MQAEYERWLEYIDIFSHCVHPRYGYFVHFPFAGGYMDQPCRDMWVLDLLLDEYRKVLKEQNEKAMHH